MSQSYIGSRINLFTKNNLRYQGTVYHIDPIGSAVTLRDVQCFGTEDREIDPTKMIAPSSVVESIRLFNGSEVANLNIVTFSDHLQAPAHQPESQPQAQPQSQTSPTSANNYTRPAQPAPQAHSNNNGTAAGQNPQYNNQFTSQTTNAWKAPLNNEASNQGQYGHSQQSSEIGSGPQNGPYDGSNYRSRGSSHPQNRRRPPVPRTDFDFEQSNAKFDKSQLHQEFRKMSLSNGSEQAEVPTESNASADTFYNKGKSFFDNISCESKDKQADRDTNDRRNRNNQERRNNFETFGQSHVPRGRGGHRGRGGNRGGYYRGRGNYQNNNNENSNYYNNRPNYRNNHYNPNNPNNPNNPQNNHYNANTNNNTFN